MNRAEQHPDSVLLDQLRAGLLNDNPPTRAVLEQHLEHCAHCRRAYDWPARLRTAAPAMDLQLDRLRRQALAATPAAKRPQRRWLPVAAAAVLGLLAVSLFNLLPTPETSSPQIAAGNPSVPDLYEDLDFYLWLADHKGDGDSST